MLHPGGGGSLLRGEREGAHTLQPHFPQELAQLHKFLLTLTGQAGNQAGTNDKAGNSLPELSEKLPQECTVSAPVHQTKNAVVAMLNGDIQIFDDFRLGGHHVHEFVVNFIGIDIVHPNPLEPVDFAKLPQKLGQQAPVAGQIGAVAAGILGHHDELLHAVGGQEPGLIEHIVHLPAAVFAPQGGNDAVGAVVVAALGDLDKGIMPGGGQDSAGLLLRRINGTEFADRIIRKKCLNGRNDFRIASGAEKAVHLGHFLQDLLLIPLGQAAGHQNFSDFPLRLQGPRHQDVVNCLGFRRIDESAGVDDHHIAAHNVAADGMSGLLHAIHHSLAVHLILGTAKGNKTYIRHDYSSRKSSESICSSERAARISP